MAQYKRKSPVPSQYLAGLSPAARKRRKAEIKRRRNQSGNYSKFSTDFVKGKRRKTKKSIYTLRYERQYGSKKSKRK
tara:strand:+ start:683 stop:913 length:231 start_codon:yes stop_codon:yes gene_type:complete